MRLTTTKGIQITIEDKHFASGGEGQVHKIILPTANSGYCVKLFYPHLRTKQKKDKIGYLVANPPSNLKGTQYMICWPVEMVFEKGKFAGFVMPMAAAGNILLYELCNPSFRKKFGVEWKIKYDRNTIIGLENRFKLLSNISITFYQIHITNKYVLVDIKPQNILIDNTGFIWLIDIDSMQVAENGRKLFEAKVATPEFAPPESKLINPSKDLVSENWDRFSLAVVNYLVLFGIHPYTANFATPYDKLNETSECIRQNLFVHGNGKVYLTGKAALHDNFNLVPPVIQQLFTASFSTSQNAAVRPSAEDWGKTINILLSSSALPKTGFKMTIPKPNPSGFTVGKNKGGGAILPKSGIPRTNTKIKNPAFYILLVLVVTVAIIYIGKNSVKKTNTYVDHGANSTSTTTYENSTVTTSTNTETSSLSDTSEEVAIPADETASISNEKISKIIKSLYQYTSDENWEAAADLYSYYIENFYSVENITRDKLIEICRSSKTITTRQYVRENTIDIQQNGISGYVVSYQLEYDYKKWDDTLGEYVVKQLLLTIQIKMNRQGLITSIHEADKRNLSDTPK